MCDPATLLAGGLSALGSLLGMGQSQPAPPPNPAAPALANEDRAPGATVRLGAGKEDKTSTDAVAGPVLGFTERRASGTSLTRGRSGLAI